MPNEMGSQTLTFYGKVEDINDPLQLGRVRVRVFSEHESLDVEDLLWATVLLPVTSASLLGTGSSPTGLLVGSYVMGIYLDAHHKQQQIVIGSLAKIPGMDESLHDVSGLAREKAPTINQVGPEPASAYEAKYPFNKVVQTVSGHTVELDDTPGAERIKISHKAGTYTEINAEGRRVNKTAGDNFDVIVGNDTVYIQGDCKIQVMGKCDITVGGAATISAESVALTASGAVSVKASSIKLN